jgi:hypothetical protein
MPYLFGPLHILVANFVDTFITSNFGLFGIVVASRVLIVDFFR